MRHKFYILVLIVLCFSGCHKPVHHPLVVSSINPRYFADGSGKIVYLTGAHTWNNLVDMTFAGNNNIFDYPAYIEFLEKYHHNFIRLWTWELLDWNTAGNRDENPRDYVIDPHAWSRTGPGTAIDGRPKFDLTKYNPEYFNRLRSRVEMAREHGIYVSIMLFEGWGIQFSPDSYRNHPFYPDNNINNDNNGIRGN